LGNLERISNQLNEEPTYISELKVKINQELKSHIGDKYLKRVEIKK